MPTDRDIEFAKAFFGTLGMLALGLVAFCIIVPLVLNLPRYLGETASWLITRREALREPALFINARTRPGGEITAELLDRRNCVVPGFSHAECRPFTGDAVRHELRWRGDRLPDERIAADTKIRFRLRDADLFSYLPASLDPAATDLARFQTKGP